MRMSDGSLLDLPANSSMTWAVAFSGQWDTAHVEAVRSYIHPGTLALDIGASLGLWTVQLARAARSAGAEVWAVEPVPANVSWLERNVSLNRLEQVVKIFPVALGSTAGIQPIELDEPGGGNAHIGLKGRTQSDHVKVLRLDDLPRMRPVSFIKIDVEGFELEVLRGAQNLLAEDRPVVFGEFSRVWLKARNEDLGAFLRGLAQLGYQSHTVELRRSRPWLAPDRVGLMPLDVSGDVSAEDLLLIPSESVAKTHAPRGVSHP